MGAKRSRSRSLCRAAKRARGVLRSQNEPAEPWGFGADDGSGTFMHPDADFVPPKLLFRRYYQDLGIVNDTQEWQAMYDKFHAPLPVTFRFTALVSAEFRRTGERLVARCAGARRIHVADGWQLREDKWALRSAPPSSPQAQLRSWLIEGNDSGQIIRQELASMLPVALLGHSGGCRLLDMCAAPGSKTTQAIDMICAEQKRHAAREGGSGGSGGSQCGSGSSHCANGGSQCGSVLSGNSGGSGARLRRQQRRLAARAEAAAGAVGAAPSQGAERADERLDLVGSGDGDGDGGGDCNHLGVVVANDATALRCCTLAKRCAALGPRVSSVLVTNHRGQCFPLGGFDRIVCDVPCSGDGTGRKHPEVFSRWEPLLAVKAHPMQLQIAMRGAALLSVGGRMVYSTCSLSPIEDEAVVAELLRRCDGALELLDATDTATAIAGGCRPGLTSWPVVDGKLKAHASFEALQQSLELPLAERRKYRRGMWPPPPESAADLRRCVRLHARPWSRGSR